MHGQNCKTMPFLPYTFALQSKILEEHSLLEVLPSSALAFHWQMQWTPQTLQSNSEGIGLPLVNLNCNLYREEF